MQEERRLSRAGEEILKDGNKRQLKVNRASRRRWRLSLEKLSRAREDIVRRERRQEPPK